VIFQLQGFVFYILFQIPVLKYPSFL